MILGIKTFLPALMIAGVLATFTVSGTSRDTGIDLVRIATRFVENYSMTQHKAGDTDGMFIEDIVIPGVVGVMESYKGKVPFGARDEMYRFLIASKSMASEELSTLTARLYLESPRQFCRDMPKLGKLNSRLLLRQANDGLALSGKSKKATCA